MSQNRNGVLCGQELADPALVQIGLIIVRLARIQESLKLSKHRAPNLRTFGIVWVLLAPLLLIMAAMSTVRSDVTCRVQLLAFSLVAVASLILGVAGICRLRWAAAGLRVLSILGATYFFGSALWCSSGHLCQVLGRSSVPCFYLVRY